MKNFKLRILLSFGQKTLVRSIQNKHKIENWNWKVEKMLQIQKDSPLLVKAYTYQFVLGQNDPLKTAIYAQFTLEYS